MAKELGNIKLDRAYIGSCTGGKTSDFLEFARVLRGKRVTIDTFGVPATPEIVHDLQTARWGDKTIWEILVDAGVQMTENAGCAACLGGPVDTFGRMNTPASSASARPTAISPAAWATRNRRCSSPRRRPWPPARSRERSPIRGNICRIDGSRRA